MPTGNCRPRCVPTSNHDVRALIPSRRVLPAAVLAALCSASFASPALADTASQTAINNATKALWQAPEQSLAVAGDAFTVKDVTVDKDGGAHVRYLRAHNDIPVRGGDLVVHLRPGGALRFMTVAQEAKITDSSSPLRSGDSARTSAQSRFGGAGRRASDASLVYDASQGTPRLAHEVVVASNAGGVPSRLHVLTDADTGKELRAWDDLEHAEGSGRTQYSGTRTLYTTPVTGGFALESNHLAPASVCLIGTSSCDNVVDTDNIWGDFTAADPKTKLADASFGVNSTFDYLQSAFGRTGVYKDGTPLKLAVGLPGWSNAGNNGKLEGESDVLILFGDGDSGRPWTSVDIVAHEVAHSLTEDETGLEYSGEPGGLNEATSDIIATLTEFHTATVARPGNYDLGEDLTANATPRRKMYDPEFYVYEGENAPGCWFPGVAVPDAERPHANEAHLMSGLGNKFFFMLAEGSTDSDGAGPDRAAPTCGAPDVVGIGRNAAAQIWYRALDLYMSSTTEYVAAGNDDARAATLYAAADLYGSCSTEYKAVQAAWTATGVSGEDVTCPTIGTTTGLQQSGTDTEVNVLTNINNYGQSGTAKIEYGTTTSLGSTMTETIPVVGQYAFSFELTGLTPGTVYYYKVTNTTAGGTATTAIKTFVTSAPPQIASSGTSPMSATGQFVNWSGNTFAQSGTLKVDYGTTTSFGSTITRAIAGGGSGAFSGMSNLTGLTANTLYYYKVSLTTSRGTAATAVKTFTTGQATPILTVGAPQSLTSSTSLTGSPASDDWIHWKSTTSSTVDRRNVSPQRLSSFSKFGSGTVTLPASPTTTFSWSDAVGTASGSSAVGVATGAANGRGFWFNSTAANTEVRTLRVYVGVKGGTSASTSGQLTVSFAGDSTITPVTSSVVTAAAGTTVDRAFDVTFRPRLGTDSLKVDWQQTAGGTSAGTAVVLYAATVR